MGLLAVFLALAVTATTFWPLSLVLALYVSTDVLLQTTSAVFITQQPRVLLRTVFLRLVGFVELALAFAVFHSAGPPGSYAVAGSCVDWLRPIDAAYFSFVTMVTLGYGDVAPCSNTDFGKLVVVGQIFTSLYFLTGLFATLSSWASGGPRTPTLQQLGE